ncbi:MAG: succinate dehydrogenase assembly factor 2 [Alphaproteobacteria bacterium]|nr:succinate dehydrogenase assembly factor 2 [Alphaproteobacteria bacterium]
MSDEERRKRLRFRSWHRGTREMDLLLGSFADAHVPGFTPAQLDQYEELLTINDPDLYSWATGTAAVPPEQDGAVMQLFCAHSYSKISG